MTQQVSQISGDELRQQAGQKRVCLRRSRCGRTCAHRRHLWTGVALCLLFIALPVTAEQEGQPENESFDPPGLMASSPAGLRPGRVTEIRLRGEHLEGATGLWTSFDAEVEVVEAQAHVARFRVSLPAEAQVGIGAVRVVTERGMSPPALVMVDDLPTRWDGGANHSPEEARPLSPPVAVAGNVPRERSRFYRITAEAGESLSIDVVAQRIGSALDPIVRVLDAGTGRVIAYSDHEPGVRGDARLVCGFPAAGEYLIELRHVEHAGGGDHRYRMRIGRFPLASAPVPLAARAGQTVELRIAGPAVEDVEPMEVRVPAEARRRVPVSVRYSGDRGREGGGSGFVELMVSSIEELTLPPRDGSEGGGDDDPVAIHPPIGVNALLARPGERHVYEFEAAEGQRLHVSGYTDALGSPARLYMELHDADGERVARTADVGTAEGSFTHTIGAGGTYRLVVEDLHRRGGAEYAYRVAIVGDAAPFALSAHAHTVNVRAGGEAAVKVTAERDGYDGPITLSLEGWDGEGDGAVLAVGDNVIEDGESDEDGENGVELKLRPAADAEPGRWHMVRIVGRAEVDGREHRVAADTTAALAERWQALRHGAPAVVDGQVVVNILPPEPEAEESDDEPDDDGDGDDERRG